MAPRRTPRRSSSTDLALWRHEQIQDALDEKDRVRRGAVVKRIAQTTVVWPSGEERSVSVATAYRWIRDYEQRGGLQALRPTRRKDSGTKRASLPDGVVKKALSLWSSNQPWITLTFLLALLGADPEFKDIPISRSTLARRLAAEPLYTQLRRARRRQRQRTRFVAREPHDLWQLDAKGPIPVTLASGERITFHVLTVLDDATRDTLAAIVTDSPDLAAAVRVFRRAVERWGLPRRVYCDRASIFDSKAFRTGLALLGVHRIWTRGRNAPAHGKIEAYHRSLVLWFVEPLKQQQVIDAVHLQKLLDAVLERVYRDHRHRGLKMPPRQALADRRSPRTTTTERLLAAFRQERWLKAHPKTGEVDIDDATYLVPDLLRGQRVCFLIDPEPHVPPLFIDPETGHHLPLSRAAIRPKDAAAASTAVIDRWGQGPLQTLYDAWQGKTRPQAEPGFGLPEMLELLGAAVGRSVPRSDAEAALVQRLYGAIAPLPRKATEAALADIAHKLGPGRPLQAYLDALTQRVIPIPAVPKRRKTS